MTALALLDAPFAHHGPRTQRLHSTSASDATDVRGAERDKAVDPAWPQSSGRKDLHDRGVQLLGGALELAVFRGERPEPVLGCLLFLISGHDRMMPRLIASPCCIAGSSRGDQTVTTLDEITREYLL